jgi:hypothetical protein
MLNYQPVSYSSHNLSITNIDSMTSPDVAIAPTDQQPLTIAANWPQAGPRPDSKTLTMALLDAERAHKQDRPKFPAETLLGEWRLRFTAPNKPRYKDGQPTARGYYLPGWVVASIGFERDATGSALTIRNQLKLGPLKVRFVGPARLLDKRNLLAFDFVQLQLWLANWRLLSLPIRGGQPKTADFLAQSIAKLPFFAFFAVTENYIAARGKSGGLALWVKAPRSSRENATGRAEPSR